MTSFRCFGAACIALTAILGSHSVKAQKIQFSFSGEATDPVASEGIVYFGTIDGHLNAVRATDGSIVAGFPVDISAAMGDGSTKSIERVQAGDLVLTRDQNDDANGKVVAKRVLSTSVREAQATATVTLLTGENIECTPEHPFYAAGRGFVEAKDLGIGTSIVTRAGPAVQVASVERHDAPATVYNFVVEDTHTYFVGTANGGVEVHNACTAVSMDDAIGQAVEHVGPNGVLGTTPKGNFQFMSSELDASGNTVTRLGRLDVNPADQHAFNNPHLNLETHINGKPVGNVHTGIDPGTIRPGDIP